MTADTVDPQRPLGALVEETPAFARVFESFGIDYCCGGDASLAAACSEKGIELSTIREELASVRAESGDEDRDWASMSSLIDHIVAEHHDYLREELPALEDLARKVASVHGDNHPELREIETVVLDLAEEMRTHISEEEDDVFPVIERLERDGSLTESDTQVLREAFDDLEADHEATASFLDRIADLSDEYTVPDDACASYRSLYQRLEELERNTHRHVHKENNVLFLEAEQELAA